jgi:hypothetical protein
LREIENWVLTVEEWKLVAMKTIWPISLKKAPKYKPLLGITGASQKHLLAIFMLN